MTGGNGSGPHSTAKQANHLPVELRVIVSVFILPSIGRCSLILTWPILDSLSLPDSDSEPRLRKGEAVISRTRTEAREARLFTPLYPAKESVKCFIESPQNVLQYLRVNRFQLRPNRFYFRQLVLLIFVGYRLARHSISIAPFLQPGIIEFTAQSEPTRETSLLCVARIDSVFVCS